MSFPIDSIALGLFTLKAFDDELFVERLVKILINGPEFLRPKLFGRFEPLESKVEKRNLTELVKQVVCKENQQDVLLILEFCNDGSFMIRWTKSENPGFSYIDAAIPYKVIKQANRLDMLLSLFKELIIFLDPVYAEIKSMAFRGWDTPMDLKVRLPEIPWLSVYGKPYIELFGRRQILTAPFFKNEILQSGHLLLQATDSVFGPIPNDLRKKIRNHICVDAFMAGTKWRYKEGVTPPFDFSKLKSK